MNTGWQHSFVPEYRRRYFFCRMKVALLAFGIACSNLELRGQESEKDWKRLLDATLVDEWLPIFGAALSQPARPAETWARKFAEFQVIIGKSTGGRRVPIYLSPELAATMLPAVPATPEGGRTGLPLSRVPVGEALKYIVNLTGMKMRITDAGVLLELQPKASSK